MATGCFKTTLSPLFIEPSHFVNVAGVHRQQFIGEDGRILCKVFRNNLDFFELFGLSFSYRTIRKSRVFFAFRKQKPSSHFGSLDLAFERKRR